jgi:antitoxin YefM
MIAINYSTARQSFKEYCDKTVNDFETVIITRERGENVVLISESEYNNMLENLHVRSNPKDYQRLLDSVADLKAGRNLVVKTMQELEAMEHE